MDRAHDESAHVIVRSPVRANRSPRREAAYVRQCALRRIAARPSFGRAIRPMRGHRRVRRAHGAPRRTTDSADGEIDARAFLASTKVRAVSARAFALCGER